LYQENETNGVERKKGGEEMKAIIFKEANRNLLKPQNMTDEECKNLWVYTDGKQCISCWKLSFKQRLSALIHGRVWLSVLSGQTQPPVWLDCAKTVFQRTVKGR
jgi:hypothetical protein